MTTSNIVFFHAITPVHAGTGQGVGIIDLPISREKATNLPIIPGSSIKGVLRDACTDKNIQSQVFGPEGDDADKFAGAISISDARLLCLPVRSYRGTFAWITSPMVLRRLQRDGLGAGLNIPTLSEDQIATKTDSALKNDNNKVFLEELDLTVDAALSDNAERWADAIAKKLFTGDAVGWQKLFKERFAIVNDDVFAFLYETATEVVARIKIDDFSKTASGGALWYEENLPAESVLWAVAVASPSRKSGSVLTEADVMENAFANTANGIQVGGHDTVGRGRMRVVRA